MDNQTLNSSADGANNADTMVQIPLTNDVQTAQQTQNGNCISNIKLEMLTPADLDQAVKELKNTFRSGKTKEVRFRKKQLRQLLKMLAENKDEICAALRADLNKPPFETLLCEYNLIVNELTELEHEVDSFARPESKAGSMLTFFDKLYVQQEPLGTVLVMGAWNYPLLLSLQPFAGALAAGNCVLMKMSEHSPNTGKVLASLFLRYLSQDCYRCVNCDLSTTQHLLAHHTFDHIFYTGGDNGGKAVYSAASKNLTPIVLELGGKSPVYIDDDVCDREAVWNRLFWGKFLNAGQTCIAPDYVLCSEKAQQVARRHFHKCLNQFYNGDALASDDYPRIVNSGHFERLKRLLKESRIVVGGKLNPDKLSIEPAIVLDVSLEDAIMQEEIFGPILPFVTCSSSQRAIDMINSRPKPLALYIFSDSKKVQDKFLAHTSSGGVCINDTILQISAVSLPFGGVGGSGFGKYHGKYTLDTFSNQRAVLARGFNPILEWIGSSRYPPYNDNKLTILTQLGMNRKLWTPGPVLTNFLAFAIGVGSVFAYQALSTFYRSEEGGHQ